MEGSTPVSMDQSGIEAFLGPGGTCVLAVGGEPEPYAVPVSYVYDRDAGQFYLRLGTTPDSEKAPHVAEGARARVVVYDVEGDRGHSVIADGTLDPVATEDLTPDLVETLADGEFPRFELWPEEKADIDFTVVRLDPDSLTGRRSPE